MDKVEPVANALCASCGEDCEAKCGGGQLATAIEYGASTALSHLAGEVRP
jgi:hypothetical protein